MQNYPEKNGQIWSTAFTSGLRDSGVGSTSGGTQNPRGFSCLKSTPLRCHLPVKSQSSQGSFQISLISFYSLGPPTYVLFYANPMCRIPSVFYPQPNGPMHTHPNLKQTLSSASQTQNNVDLENISNGICWAGISLIIWTLVEFKLWPHPGLRKIR